MAIRSQRPSHSWLQQVAALLGAKQRPKRPIRRLLSEMLDRRIVLSVAPVPGDEDATTEPSLAEYASQEPVMGPLPAEDYVSGSDDSTTTVSDPAPADAYFANFEGQGEGEGSGSGSGDGSGAGTGSGSGAGSGSGSGYGTGSGSGYGTGSGSGTGSGTGTGSGSGGASGSGSTNLPPIITTVDKEENYDWLVLSGGVKDDGPVAGLTVTAFGLVDFTTTTSELGYFVVQVPHPNSTGSIWFSVTDVGGLTSELYELFLG